MTYKVVAGWTAPIDIDLKSKGVTPAGTMAGITATLVLGDSAGTDIEIPASILDSDNWRVRVEPGVDDFVAGTFYGRIKVSDSGGLIGYFPSNEPDVWQVLPVTYP